jgi:transposase
MGTPETLSHDPVQELERIVGERWRLEAFKRFQCVWLSQALQLGPKDIAEALGLNVGTVRRIQAAYRRDGRLAIEGRGNRGGRRHDYLTFKEEAAFLNAFARQLKNGRVHTISSIKTAYEAQIGKKVNKTTIYRLLERHGWGSVATRIHRPARLPDQERQVS